MGIPLRVLIVEDSEDDAMVLVYALKKGGFEPTFKRVETPGDMSECLKSAQWDLILSDHNMPQFNSFAALKLLQESEKDIPFIIVSGAIGEDVAVLCMKAGAHDYLFKNDLARLIPAVKRELKEASKRQEHRRAEEALRVSESRYRTLVENIPQKIFMKDRDSVYVSVNENFARDIGIRPEDIVGKADYDYFPKELAEKYRSDDRRIMESGHFEDIEEQYIQDGKYVWVHTVKAPVRDSRGEIVGILGIFWDISERKRMEEALRQSEEQLRQSQKMEAVGRLAGGIAHDFNNMLSVIINYSELVISELRPGDPLRSDMGEILKAGQRSADLTRQLLAFSRRQVLAPEILDLDKALKNIEPMLRRIIGEDIDFIYCPSESLCKVKADPGQIEQVIMNLAVNSRDAMPEGGKLTIETDNVELDDEYAAIHPEVMPGHYVVLSVTDTGCGMDQKTKEHIFEPFYTTKETGKGTGLGLSTVYGIVKQSGGHIWVYSEAGKGTTFKIYFPRESSAAPVSHEKKTYKLATGTETVLVVEDEPGVRELAKRVLDASGYTVHTAANGGEALLICEREGDSIQLMITDIVMPEMSGRELAERLEKICPNMKVLYMSGYTENAIVHHGVLEKDINFITKPFSLPDLTSKVREILDE